MIRIARAELTFQSGTDRCAAWLYQPTEETQTPGRGPAPVIVLAHGFGLVREGRLDAYAERFAAAGYAAFVFDYRHFGASTGTPRQLLDITRQLDDWRAAIATVRDLEGLDPDRVVLWGTSFSGGHVAALAAEDARVAAVISQVPYAGLGGAKGRRRIGHLVRLVGAAVRDEVCGRTGRAPATIPIVAEPGSFGALIWPGAPATMAALLPETTTWVNAYTPRVTLRLPRYRPFDSAERIGCPWLVLVCDQDRITPPDEAAALASRAPRVELHRLATGHFDVYTGDWFERVIALQLGFLQRHLGDR